MNGRADSLACPDCGADVGALHTEGCDVEPCGACGGQRIGCGCHSRKRARRIAWSGDWPGDRECREFGFWVLEQPNQDPWWKEVPTGTPGAVEDLSRLRRDCRWDADAQRWVRR